MTDYDPFGEKPPGQTPADVPLNALPVVELTDDQLQHARRIAQARNQSYDSIDGGRVCGEQSSTDAHTTGAVGEIAYAIQYDEQVDESIYAYGDGGRDFTAGPIEIDTKNTRTHIDRPALVVPVEPEPTADVYFLLHQIGEQTVRIVGFATIATVMDREPVPKPGDTLNYVVPQDELWLPPDLQEEHPDELSEHSPSL